MSQTLISLGANLGNPRQVMQIAGEMILEGFGTSNVALSQLYRTPAVGGPTGQDDFYNAVATIESNHTAFEVWRRLHEIEQSLGRRRRHRWEARRIDLDVLLHNGERHWTPTLKIPHPRMITRTFVLEPACEVALRWIEPVTGRTIEDLSEALRRIRANELAGQQAVHLYVVSESDERNQQIANQLASGSTPTTSHETPEIDDDPTGSQRRFSVSSNASCTVTFQSLAHSAIRSRVVDIQHQLQQQIVAYQAQRPVHLLVFAGASPDSTVIHWEDYCRRWAEWLGLVSTDGDIERASDFRRLPKYLLSAEDPIWAAHELRAAMTAMTCPIQACGAFFDD